MAFLRFFSSLVQNGGCSFFVKEKLRLNEMKKKLSVGNVNELILFLGLHEGQDGCASICLRRSEYIRSILSKFDAQTRLSGSHHEINSILFFFNKNKKA